LLVTVRGMYPQSMAPTTVDERYSRLGRLGGGGMAEVYLAYDALLGREVALKVLREHNTGSADCAERFRREVRHAAALSHPNIVEVYDGGKVLMVSPTWPWSTCQAARSGPGCSNGVHSRRARLRR
jgi:hypothetical protein